MSLIEAILYALVLIMLPLMPAHAQASKATPRYQCMTLKDLWDGQGPMPPPVFEYTGPSPAATSAGIAPATLIVDAPFLVIDGRLRVIRPNRAVVWIDRSQVKPWRVVSNPGAVCSVVVLPSGTLQTTSR